MSSCTSYRYYKCLPSGEVYRLSGGVLEYHCIIRGWRISILYTEKDIGRFVCISEEEVFLELL